MAHHLSDSFHPASIKTEETIRKTRTPQKCREHLSGGSVLKKEGGC